MNGAVFAVVSHLEPSPKHLDPVPSRAAARLGQHEVNSELSQGMSCPRNHRMSHPVAVKTLLFLLTFLACLLPGGISADKQEPVSVDWPEPECR